MSDEDEEYYLDRDQSSEKKSRKKKKSSSSSSSKSKSLPVSTLDSTQSKQISPFAKLVNKVKLASTSPKSLMSRVILLAMFSLFLIASFVYYQQMLEDQAHAEMLALASKNTRRAVDDEVIVQKVAKETPKMSIADERKFGCKEVSCIAECNGKAKPKCLKSKSCVAERYHICHKRCRRTRCEERCKNEPKMGYVEKEQGLENCKEACTGPVATHNKCIVKCHIKFKPCKTKCHESASKFKCDNPKILALLEAKPAEDEPPPSSSKQAKGGKGEEDEEDEGEEDDGGGSAEDDDEEGEEEEARAPPKQKQKPALPGLDDDDLL